MKFFYFLKGRTVFEDIKPEEFKGFMKSKNGVYSYVKKDLISVSPRKISQRLLFWYPWFYRHYGLNTKVLKGIHIDYIVFESGQSILHFQTLKKRYPKAKFIYRVSDDVRLIAKNPAITQQEELILPLFDKVSVTSDFQYRSYVSYYSAENLVLNYHGVNTQLLDNKTASPYSTDSIHIAFIGTTMFDYSFLKVAHLSFPNCQFHIVGPIVPEVIGDNITYYGEVPFEDTIPYIQHADVCLSNRSYSTGAEMLTDTNKILQYTYAAKPIIAPHFIKTQRENTFCYTPDNKESIIHSIHKAIAFSKQPFPEHLIREIQSWDQVARDLVSS